MSAEHLLVIAIRCCWTTVEWHCSISIDDDDDDDIKSEPGNLPQKAYQPTQCFAAPIHKIWHIKFQQAVVAVWHSGSALASIKEVTVCQARLVLGWVTGPGSTSSAGNLSRYITSHPGQLSLAIPCG